MTIPASWFHDEMIALAACRRTGDEAGVAEVLDRIGIREPRMRRLAEQALAAAVATERGHQGPHGIGLAGPDELLCDFCAANDPAVFYPFAEFAIEGAATWMSGDRMYACVDCAAYVDADDWQGLRERVGDAARSEGVRLLWFGFRRNRTGGPQPV